jgi:hypothetical protein
MLLQLALRALVLVCLSVPRSPARDGAKPEDPQHHNFIWSSDQPCMWCVQQGGLHHKENIICLRILSPSFGVKNTYL